MYQKAVVAHQYFTAYSIRVSFVLLPPPTDVKALDALHSRNSAPRLKGTVSEKQLDNILKAGLRAPDHAQLRPWRIFIVERDARERLGELFAQAKLTRDPDQSPEQLAKLKSKPLRAPLVIVVAAKVTAHEKVPEIEQMLSAGAVAQNMLVAAHAQGLGAMWRTGEMAYDAVVHKGLGLRENEKIVGFLYIGEIDGRTKEIQEIEVSKFVSKWDG